MNTQLFDVRTADNLEAESRLVDFVMPEDVPAPGAPNNRPVGRGKARRARAPKPDSRSARRRVALAAGLVVFLISTALAMLAFDNVRAEMARQKRGITELLGRAETAEADLSDLRSQERAAAADLSDLRRQERAAAAANASLNSELSGLKQAQFDVAGVARQVQPSVVTIGTARGFGSGFVVLSRDGTSSIVTNFHVVASAVSTGERTVLVGLRNGSVQGTIVKVSEENDLALITVTTSLPALALATGTPGVGDPVLVAGTPRGLEGSVTSGIVSGLRTFGGMPFIQLSAPTSPGNSGGPVVDRAGKVLGVVTMKDTAPGTEGLSFAIPFFRVCAVLIAC